MTAFPSAFRQALTEVQKSSRKDAPGLKVPWALHIKGGQPQGRGAFFTSLLSQTLATITVSTRLKGGEHHVSSNIHMCV